MAADGEAPRRGGGLQRLVLWLVIVALLATVWVLASERNERRFRAVSQGSMLVIERGRFFPTGTAPRADDKLYAPVAIPAGEKPPAEIEFDEQNAADRWLFDLLTGWAKGAASKNDTHTAAALADRASQLPGLNGAQLGELSALKADLAWDEAQADVAGAARLLDAARRKLEVVRQNNGLHAPDAAQLSGKLEAAQKTVQDLGKH